MGDDDALSWDESIFRDERVFEIDWVPESFRHRETQQGSLQYALKPAIRGSRPLNCIVKGPPGTGKTTTIQKLFGELNPRSGVHALRVNCQVNSTRYAIFGKILTSLLDYDPPRPGIQFNQLYERLAEALTEQNKVLIVALDDVNYLFYEEEADDTLYSLLRAYETHSGTKIGVILISSDLGLELLESLDSRVKSVFRPEEIYFPTYDIPEIADILAERAKRGFYEEVVDSRLIDRVAELTAKTGDLRVGIDLLRRAGLHAEMRASTSLNMQDVQEAYDKSKHAHLSHKLQGLNTTEAELIRVIAENEGMESGELYTELEAKIDIEYTRYSELINQLDQLGLIETDSTISDGETRSRTLSLVHHADAILERIK